MQWPTVHWLHRAQDAANRPIDMGNGRVIRAADVLDGHARRLMARTVQVQVKPDLQAAISVLAPDLAPLTNLAEEVANTTPRVEPTQRFRDDLHRALEQSHRQHAAQRHLGICTDAALATQSSAWRWSLFAFLTTLILTVSLGGLVMRRRKLQPLRDNY